MLRFPGKEIGVKVAKSNGNLFDAKMGMFHSINGLVVTRNQ
jgi:hypothetical protein